MKLFLDTNVILDLYLPERDKNGVRMVMSVGDRPFCRNCVSALSIANMAYILRKILGKEATERAVKEITDNCRITEIPDTCVYDAIGSECPDFEDAMQISSAELNGCDVIVTNNKKHFTGYTFLPVYTPKEFLEHLRHS